MTTIYKALDQRLASKLLWDDTIVSYINFALADIYSYKWTSWTFMYWKQDITFSSSNDQITFTLDKPILRVFKVTDNSDNELSFDTSNVDEELDNWQIYFRPHEKTIKIKNNTDWITLHYLHTFNSLSTNSIIPLPDLFLWALFNRVLSYCYPSYWQYWDWKDTVVMSKYIDQMENFRMIDSLQLTWISTEIY